MAGPTTPSPERSRRQKRAITGVIGVVVAAGFAYYVGTLANVLPVPGGIGGVEAGMIGAFLAFGVQRHLAVLAVLAYRTISFWLPTIPGAIAYLRLRRQFHDADDEVPQPEG